jgi:hypothetical protein
VGWRRNAFDASVCRFKVLGYLSGNSLGDQRAVEARQQQLEAAVKKAW